MFLLAVLSPSGRHQLPRSLPELLVDEIGGDASHQCELIGLTWPDLELARLEPCKGLFDQLIRSYQGDALAFGKLRGHSGFHRWRHKLDHLYVGFLQLEP